MGKWCRGWSSLIPIVVFRGDYIINHEILKQIAPEIWITNHEISTLAEKRPSPKETIVFQPSIFRCYLSFRECISYGCFQKIIIPQNGFIMENPIKMDDLGVPLFLETPISIFIPHLLPSWNLTEGSSFPPMPWLVVSPERSSTMAFADPIGWDHSKGHQAPQRGTWKLRKTPGPEGWLYGCGVWWVFLGCVVGCFCF